MPESSARRALVPQIERDAYEPSWYRVLAGMHVDPSEGPPGGPDPSGDGNDEEFVDLTALEAWAWATGPGGRGPHR